MDEVEEYYREDFLSDENDEFDIDEPQIEDINNVLQDCDDQENERLKEQEEEIMRLWEAKTRLLSQMDPSKTKEKRIPTLSDADSVSDEIDSVISQPTDASKIDRKETASVKSFTFSTRLPCSQKIPVSTFIERDRSSRSNGNGQSASIHTYDDPTSGLGSLSPSPLASPLMWRSEKIIGRGFCSALLDDDRFPIERPQPVVNNHRKDSGAETDVFKDISAIINQGLFARIRARMDANASVSSSPVSFDDQYINVPMISNENKSHFDYDQEYDYHQTHIIPQLLQDEQERRKQETTIDFSFKIGEERVTSTESDTNSSIAEEEEPYLSIIVDNNNIGLKRVCKIFDQYQLVYDRDCILHDQWYYGLISYTFLLKQSVKIVNSSVMKLLQQQLKQCDTFWISNGLKKRPIFNDPYFNIDETPPVSTLTEDAQSLEMPPARPSKFHQLARCFFYINCQMEWSAGALVAMNSFSSHEKLSKQPYQKWQLRFCEDFVDFIYQTKERSNPNYEYVKRLPANFIDKSVIITTSNDGFVLYVQMKGNVIELINTQPWWVVRKLREKNQPILATRQAIQRQASRYVKPFCSTIRISIKVSTLKDNSQKKSDRQYQNQTIEDYDFRMDRIVIQNIRVAFREFLAFFYRHRIQICFAGSIMDVSYQQCRPRVERPIFDSFIKNYSWQMLLSLGHRFQQRLQPEFIDYLRTIKSNDRFYQLALHIWRRAKEYHFLNIDDEVKKYLENLKEINPERNSVTSEICSFASSSKNLAHAPSVTITATSIYVKPLKLAKTNRVIREPKFGGPANFCLVEIREETGEALQANDYAQLRSNLEGYLEHGFKLADDRLYRYLHHSQSQLKEKQFWFYWSDDKNRSNFSFDEAYQWMGNFEQERVVAKHAARIAQCFTSSSATIRVPREKTQIIDDIERNGYIFTDGVGTFSSVLRDEICSLMGFRRKFSVMQIRYGGCKGTVSVNPELDSTDKELILRKSMHKFLSDHDVLELCKISAPRPIHLNRQAIALLESRHIPHSIFLLLQNQHLLRLIESLLYLPSTFELLHEELQINMFPLRDLILLARIDLIHEPFFRQLITTICQHEIKRMEVKTRIRISNNCGRNMFGIVDETGILEYGQVFCQYTQLNTEYLEDVSTTNRSRAHSQPDMKHVVVGKIVVTKNPCHHPGDLRTFEAVDVPQLRHLVDCIVFPQRGHRPHPNEISGSDLDGDEYAVYWHPDLIPTTENFPPYEYDSQEKPKKLERPVTRDDIRQIVLEISEQDALGRLSNLHLAFTDKFNIRHPDAIKIAAAIAEEVDAGKTGKHPLTDSEIAELARKLNNERADFFNRPKQFDLYSSSNTIGILFRAVRRSDAMWSKINRCLHIKATIGLIQSSHISAHLEVDPYLIHPLWNLYRAEAENLFEIYRDQISDIMYVYHFHSEVDLICKFDSQQKSISKQFDIADSAQIELTRLHDRIRRLFYDCPLKTKHPSKCSCNDCDEHRMARASACYCITYQQQHAKKILSFPWIFSSLLVKLRRKNHTAKAPMVEVPSNYFLVGQAFLHSFSLLIEHQSLRYTVDFDLMKSSSRCELRWNFDGRYKKYLHVSVTLMEWAMLEIVTGWLDRQEIFSTWKHASRTANRPIIHLRTWKHVTTQFLLSKYRPKTCSKLILQQNRFLSKQTLLINNEKNPSVSLTLPKFSESPSVKSIPTIEHWWSDQLACEFYKALLTLTGQCSRTHTLADSSERMDLAHLNEYLTLGLLVIAAENEFGNLSC